MIAYSCSEIAVRAEKCNNPDTGAYENRPAEDFSNCILMACVDNCGMPTFYYDEMRSTIEKQTGVPADNIYIHADHTHTAPYVVPDNPSQSDAAMIREYGEFVKKRFADAASVALRDPKPARMGIGTVRAPERIAYIRRYKMKDGSTVTCPPIGDANIDHPLGTLDQRVNLIRFDREVADSVVILNYGLHADTLNLDEISADWPGELCRAFEAVVTDAKIVAFVGAQGDVGSTHIFPEPGDMNDTRISFDNEMKSSAMCRFVGRALAGAALQIYDKVEYVDVDSIAALRKTVSVAANVPTEEELPTAHLYKKLHEAGRGCDIPYTAMALTTAVATAFRMCRLENGPECFRFDLTGVKIGPVAFCGIPGEPFTEIGRQIKLAPGWKMVCPTINTNGKEGYFPMKSDYADGGYEAGSSPFRPGVAETIIDGALRMLNALNIENAGR